MRRRTRIAAAAILALSGIRLARAADVSVGVAAEDITPPKGWRMAGYFSERVSTGTHDPLAARAIVFAQGDDRAALVFCDLIGIPLRVSREARRRASETTGIPAANIAILATHTHTGPLFFGPLREHFHQTAIAKEGRDPHEPIDYSAALVEKIADVVARAQAVARPAEIDVGTAVPSPPLSFNRRYRMKDGSVRFNPGQQNPDIVGPAGPIDPAVGVLLFRDRHQRRPVAVLTVFAMHPDTTGGTEYSADYPFYLQETLRAALGGDVVSVFGTGTCGDINHIDVNRRDRPTARAIGNALGETVLAAIPKLRPVADARLRATGATVEAALHRYTAEQEAEAAKNLAQVGTGKVPFLKEVEACRIMDLKARKGSTLALEVQAFRLSRDVAVVTLPSEIFVELGLAIQKASPFKTTFVIELANDGIGYIPTKKAFTEGSYEVINSRVQSGTGEKLVDAAVRLLQELSSQ